MVVRKVIIWGYVLLERWNSLEKECTFDSLTLGEYGSLERTDFDHFELWRV